MLSYSEMHILAEEINHVLKGAVIEHITEISERKWQFACKKKDELIFLLICTNVPFHRFHLIENPQKGKRTPFANQCEKELKNESITMARVLPNERILEMQCEKNILFLELFSKRALLVITDKNKKIRVSSRIPFPLFYEIPQQKVLLEIDSSVQCTNREIEKRYQKREAEELFLKRKKEEEARVKKEITNLDRLEEKLREDIERGKEWIKCKHEAKLLQSYFNQIKKGESFIELHDWEKKGALVQIALDPLLTPSEQIEKKSKQVRKLKGKKEHALRLLADINVQKQKKEEELKRIQGFSTIEELGMPAERKPKQLQKKEKFKRFISKKGLKIYAGRNDKENDELTLRFAKGSDYWFHVADYPGSHVVVSIPKKGEIDDESLQDALQIALHFSKAKESGSAEVIVAQRKEIKKTSRPGTVQVGKHRRLFVKKDEERINSILSRKE